MKRSNDQILKIVLIIIGGMFLFSFATCLGIGGFLTSEPEIENNKVLSENKTNLAKDKVENTIKKTENTTKNPVPTATIKPTKKPVSTATIKPTKKPDLMDLQFQILKDEFKGVADIKLKKSEKIIEIIPVDKSFMIEAQMAYDGDQVALNNWNEIIKNLKIISKNMSRKDITICIVNNLNTENYILMIANGIVLYNFIEI